MVDITICDRWLIHSFGDTGPDKALFIQHTNLGGLKRDFSGNPNIIYSIIETI